MDFRIRQLQCFLTLSNLLHYGKTARALYMSQPTITFQIKSLEEAFGTTLFERDRQQVRLTEAGVALREYAQSILHTVDAARDRLREIHTRLRLRVSCGSMGQLVLLPEVIRLLAASYPTFELEVKDLTTEEQMSQMAERRVDALLMVGELPVADGIFEPICAEPLMAVVAEDSPLAACASVSLGMLGESRIIAARARDCRFHQPFLRALFEAHGVNVEMVESPQSLPVQFAYVAAGAGVAIATQSTAMCRFPGVVVVPIAEPLPPVQLGLMSLRSNDNKAMVIFRSVVAECARNVFGNVDAGERRAQPKSVLAFPGLRNAG